METDSKIYIVVAVLAVILVGIFIFLFVMDRKIGRIEKELQEPTPADDDKGGNA